MTTWKNLLGHQHDAARHVTTTMTKSNTPAKKSKMQRLLDVVRGEKGAKSSFVKGLFGSSSAGQDIQAGLEASLVLLRAGQGTMPTQ